jgi:hypothetical protein
MQWTNFAELAASHDPHYRLGMRKIQAQWEMSREAENNRYHRDLELQNRANSQQWELARYKEEQERRREEERGRNALSVEERRGENRIQELDKELDNKIRYLGAEQHVQNAMRLLDEMAKNNDFLRHGLTEILKTKHDAQKMILQSMLNEQDANNAHWREIERRRVELEHQERLRQIDDLAKKALAYGEVVAANAGDAAAAKAIDSIVSKWDSASK